MPFKIIRDFRACSEYVQDVLEREEPVFLSRLGGSDTAAVAADVSRNSALEGREKHIGNHKRFVEKYNGFYDLDQDSENGYIKYIDTMLECYQKSKLLSVGGADLRIMLYPELEAGKTLHQDTWNRYEMLLNRMEDGSEKVLLPYEYIETMTCGENSLAKVLSSVLRDKRILVLSPFSDTIRSNFTNRQRFFKDYDYPEFELLTHTTPITYAGLPRNLYPDKNWSETASRLCEDVARIDFDVMLLCCGSYAMPLGVAAAESLGKKAIYLGGVTQLYFGIIGRRYENPFFLRQINPEYFVRPAESSKFLEHVSVAPGSETEAFGAYF